MLFAFTLNDFDSISEGQDWRIIKYKGMEWFNEKFLHWLTPISITALLLTLVLLFSFKGEVIINNPLTILWIFVKNARVAPIIEEHVFRLSQKHKVKIKKVKHFKLNSLITNH